MRDLAPRLPFVLAAGPLLGLAAGATAYWAGYTTAGRWAWAAAGAWGAAQALWATVSGLRRGRYGVDVIALAALAGAVAVGEYLASAVIGLMLVTGRALEAWATRRARLDLRDLAQRAPQRAHRHRGAVLETVDVQSVRPGDILSVAAGEVVPVDGELLSPAVVDESALTGEPVPSELAPGSPVRSGGVNAGNPFEMRASTSSEDSTYAGIVRMVSQAEAAQAPLVRLADRYALWFVAATFALAGPAWALGGPSRAVAVLVVATPCPLILAAPVAIVAGLSRAARRGVVIKGGPALERLAECTTLVMDKTGTLTRGNPQLARAVPEAGTTEEELLTMAGSLEQASAHVVANAIVSAALARGCRLSMPYEVEEVVGQGVRGRVDGHTVAVGTAAWASGHDGQARSTVLGDGGDAALAVFVAIDGSPAGVLLLDDPLRDEAGRTVRALRRAGLKRVVLLSGDRPEVVAEAGAVVRADRAVGGCSPADKFQIVQQEQQLAPTVMVGDGINDAPSLAQADIGVAMAGRGASASSEAADVVLTVDRLDRVGDARAIAHRARRVAAQSAAGGMAMSVLAMAAATAGWLPAVWGALLQEAIDVAVVLNALRALRPAPHELRLPAGEMALASQFHQEHSQIKAIIDKLGAAGDALGTLGPEEALRQAGEVYKLLVEVVQPHEEAEQSVLYPVLDRAIGGTDPTGPMSTGHDEIARQIRSLGRLLAALQRSGPTPQGLEEARRALYGLHAVLRLHTTQEDENYLSLASVPPTGPTAQDARRQLHPTSTGP